MSSNEELRSITRNLAASLRSLLERAEAAKAVEIDLRQQLAKAVDRINSNGSNNCSDGAFSSWQDEIVKQLSFAPHNIKHRILSETIPEVARAKQAIDVFEASMAAQTKQGHSPVPHRKSTTQDEQSTHTPRKCPVAHMQKPPAYEEMEQDFTTQGKPSSLECPFATMARKGPLLDQVDPIAAEFRADVLSAQSLDEARACGRCPMRFMDKHSPEEIAEYFEKHKHELPRSHEICVKRYQQNETQIRELDAKYGNIVSMIQGLGNKHKQYLASDQQEASTERKSSEAVHKWAAHVDENTQAADAIVNLDVEHGNRVSHFDKPLRDIRVGESPTRPWGISVPLDRAKAPSAASSRQSSIPSVKANTGAAVNDLPRSATVDDNASATSVSRASTKRGRRRGNQVIFNGPVFLGYSPEQAAVFLRQLNPQG